MSKEKSKQQLKVPYPPHIKIVSTLFIVLMFTLLIYIGSVTYTGLAIGGLIEKEPTNIRSQNIFLSNQFEILDIDKTPNSVLNVNVDSTIPINVFAEIDDCSYWKNGEDRDNNVWYIVNNIQKGDFKIGDPSENTIQQVDLYKADNLCLIFINRPFPRTGNVNVQYYETDINQWRII